MNDPSESLSEQIEQLVREHIEATRRAAATAVERAFSSATSEPRAGTRPGRSRTRQRTSNARRSPGELAALGEQLHQAVCAQPGETMTVLAPVVGKTPRELQRPMALLKRAGQVRSVGQRHHTRYYPTVPRAVASAG